MVAVVHLSNALGTINPVAEISAKAKAAGAAVLIDGSQAAYHMATDVAAIGADFYAFTGHKVYGPTGIGVLWGREAVLDAMPPFLGGGDMIRTVTFEGSTWNDLPYKFEAGTPNIAGAVGLGAAIDYVNGVGFDAISAHESMLLSRATTAIEALPDVRIVGTARRKASVISFVMDHVHPHDIGTVVDREGVAIRTGHHCAQPVMDRYCIPATARASFAMYNTVEDIDALVASIERARALLG
jgi:cysteine desulfurase/selenocysteine lyase